MSKAVRAGSARAAICGVEQWAWLSCVVPHSQTLSLAIKCPATPTCGICGTCARHDADMYFYYS